MNGVVALTVPAALVPDSAIAVAVLALLATVLGLANARRTAQVVRVDVADVVPVEIVEVGVQRELGQRVFLSARIHADETPEADRRQGLDGGTDIATSVLTRR